MCGIVGRSGARQKAKVQAALRLLRHRGPDASDVLVSGNFTLGHARLAIVDPTPGSDQPFIAGKMVVSYNGELWNHRELRAELEREGRRFNTFGDTEVVAQALDVWGTRALRRFEGMFAVAWTDGSSVHLARDRFGEVPLHYSTVDGISFASELKALAAFGADHVASARWVPPGTSIRWEPGRIDETSYYRVRGKERKGDYAERLLSHLQASVAERTLSDVPVCTLLSGGVDSSLVAALLKPHFPKLVCYVGAMNSASPDLAAALRVAEHLELELRVVKIPPPTPEGLAEVVRVIELPRKAQVEIGWACLHLARVMRDDGFKVTYSGEGADELFASYGFSFHGVKRLGWRDYRAQLFVSQHRNNFARCNKAFLSHSVECRLPFLNAGLVEEVLGFPQVACWRGSNRKVPLQEAAERLLPKSICWRKKVAFQDGLGLKPEAERVTTGAAQFYGSAFREFYGGAAA